MLDCYLYYRLHTCYHRKLSNIPSLSVAWFKLLRNVYKYSIADRRGRGQRWKRRYFCLIRTDGQEQRRRLWRFCPLYNGERFRIMFRQVLIRSLQICSTMKKLSIQKLWMHRFLAMNWKRDILSQKSLSWLCHGGQSLREGPQKTRKADRCNCTTSQKVI